MHVKTTINWQYNSGDKTGRIAAQKLDSSIQLAMSPKRPIGVLAKTFFASIGK